MVSSHNQFLCISVHRLHCNILGMARLKFWYGCRYFWARHRWFSLCKRCRRLKIWYPSLKILPCPAMPKILQSKRDLRCCITSFWHSLTQTNTGSNRYILRSLPARILPSTKEENEHVAIIRWLKHGSTATIPKVIIVRGILQVLIFLNSGNG